MVESLNTLIKIAKKRSELNSKKSLLVLGDHSTQHFAKSLQGLFILNNCSISVVESDYNQIKFTLNDPESILYKNKFDYVLIFETSQKLKKEFYTLSENDRGLITIKTIKRYESYISKIAQCNSSSIIIFSCFLETGDEVFGNYATKLNNSFKYQIKLLNLELFKLSQTNNNVFIHDVNDIVCNIGIKDFTSNKIYINADMPFGLDAIPLISNNIMNIVKASEGSFNKCVIVDLDNTIWGGIIGDDGLENIELGDLGIGKAFSEFQSWLLELKKRGIIICVCSKNEEKTAKEAFLKHPEMILKLEDISVFVANWKNKADNIRYIQKVLNISFDSMVFLDDNPFERNQVKSELHDVTVPDLPIDPVDYLSYLNTLNLFETASYSTLDKDRTKQYQEESLRIENKSIFSSVDDYLKSLEMSAKVCEFDEFNKARIAQLTQRSNQFNLRTVRYNEKEIQELIYLKNTHCFYVKLEDRFGRYGLISLVILKKNKDALFIDTWLMSCRVLKRGVENLVLNHIISLAQKEKANKIIGEYLPTNKNTLVKDLLKGLGFKKDKDMWILSPTLKNKKKHYIK